MKILKKKKKIRRPKNTLNEKRSGGSEPGSKPLQSIRENKHAGNQKCQLTLVYYSFMCRGERSLFLFFFLLLLLLVGACYSNLNEGVNQEGKNSMKESNTKSTCLKVLKLLKSL